MRGSDLVVSSGGRTLDLRRATGAVLELLLDDGDLACGAHRPHRDRSGTAGGRRPSSTTSASSPTDGTWQPVCAREADGAPHAVLRPAPSGAIAILCTARALGKCIRLGYRPWAERRGVAARARIGRPASSWSAADYCGDGRGTTRDGMLIDLYDDLGVQERSGAPDLGLRGGLGGRGRSASPIRACRRTSRSRRSPPPARASPAGSAPTAPSSRARRLGAPLLFNASRGDGCPSLTVGGAREGAPARAA